ncbi:LysR family transcriptional regulator [Azospirillum sp. RWY-5-1]|uniref:LysR family transcriptional regulator n=1 Tax=Azospirillum oleiclasticum TaxID=2735135 RepID=A0ABX2T500_9PROT|nr:LysR family transcriptional regulator [Azospirillum oleiclasticum]NYZ18367.1 LysR family transcriptional regulator [Azospirillum oleiclasticum]
MTIDALYRRSTITLTDLRYLVAVADHGHFGQAADACAVTQPTLSMQIAKLERCLGVDLFRRTHRQVRPTPAGEPLIDQARRVLKEADSFRRLADRAAERADGSLRLGTTATLTAALLSWLVPVARRCWPDMTLALREDSRPALLEQLAGADLDACLLGLPVEAEGCAVVPLFDEPFLVILPEAHPLAASAALDAGSLPPEPLLMLPKGHGLRAQAMDACRRWLRGIEPDEDQRATSLETIRAMVAAGVGWSLFPATALHGLPLSGIAVRPFRHPGPTRRVALLHRADSPQVDRLIRLADAVRATLPPGVLPVGGSDGDGPAQSAAASSTTTADAGASSALRSSTAAKKPSVLWRPGVRRR